jgi:hypothetical protein
MELGSEEFKLGISLDAVAIQQVKFGACGFQLRGVSRKHNGSRVAEAQRDKENAVLSGANCDGDKPEV